MTPASVETGHATLQRHTLRTLFSSQVLGGVGVASGIAVGSLLAEDVGRSTTLAGFAQTSTTLGAALAAMPMARMMAAHGRRPGLVAGYAASALGCVAVIGAAAWRSYPLLLLGLALFGCATTSNLQARYAATDLAEPARHGSSLSLIVWATTIGTVIGPNLMSPGAAVADRLGLPDLAGPYVLSIGFFVLAIGVLLLRLRPDPLLVSRRHLESQVVHHPTLRASLRVVRASRPATLALSAMAVSQAVMVSVMVMTPVHMKHGGAELMVIGFVISGHVAGMYALSPLMGWLADRFGRRPVIVLGMSILAVALAVAGTAPSDHSLQLGIGLTLLGLGWSAGLVAGSLLLTESVPKTSRPGIQGAGDLVVGLCGAAGGALGGVVVGVLGYGWLAVLCAPLLVLVTLKTLRTRAVSPAGSGAVKPRDTNDSDSPDEFVSAAPR